MLESGDTIKITQTATPVQLDQVLTSLQSDSREDLKALLDGLNASLNSKPTPAEDRDSSPLARGQTGAESFNDALDDIPGAEKSTAQVLEALLGTEPDRDVARLIRGTANTADELSRYENQLKDLITNLNLTTATFASESTNLRASIRELAPTLRNANAAFASLNAAFPSDARVRDRDPARACARRRRRSRPRSRGSSRRARSSARTSSAGWPRSSRPPPPTSRG